MVSVILEEKLRERLRTATTSPQAKNIEFEVAVTETIKFYYPDLNERQLSICVEVIYMLWDLSGLRPLNELIFRQINHPENKHALFSTAKEVRSTISELKKKGILWEKVTSWGIIFKEKTVTSRKRIVGFVRKEVEDQALKALADAGSEGAFI